MSSGLKTIALGRATVAGIAWTASGSVARQLLQMATLLVMTRLLAPREFGLIATLGVFVNLANVLANLGTAQAVVHVDRPEPRLLSSLFWLNMAVGALLFLLMGLLAWPVAWFYGEPALRQLLQALSLAFVLNAAANVHRALLEKRMLFGRVSAIELLSVCVASGLGIGAGALGWGAWSLVLMALVQPAVLAIGVALAGDFRPRLHFARTDLQRVWRYASHLTLFEIVNYFSRNADAFLIAKVFGAQALGLYSLAYRVMLYPLDNTSRVVVRVLFPALSELKHDDERFRSAYLKAIGAIAAITFPLMAGLLATANALVAVAFDARWHGLATLLMIFAPVGLVQSVVSTVGVIFNAKGATAAQLRVGVFNTAVLVAGMCAGMLLGVTGVAACYAAATLLVTYPTLRTAWSQIGLPVRRGLAELAPWFTASCFMSVVVWAAGTQLQKTGLPGWARLAEQVAIGALAYAGYLRLLHAPRVAMLIGNVRGARA